MGPDAERIDLDGAALKIDPARLADEAASISLFGGARWIRVTLAGDEALPAIEGLLQAAPAGHPVIAIGGTLKTSSKILKLALDHKEVLAFASYAPAGRADRTRAVQGKSVYGRVDLGALCILYKK